MNLILSGNTPKNRKKTFFLKYVFYVLTEYTNVDISAFAWRQDLRRRHCVGCVECVEKHRKKLYNIQKSVLKGKNNGK